MKNTLTYAELSTILAALRMFQEELNAEGLDGYESPTHRVVAMPHFEDVGPLTSPEIDSLCERLNAGEILRIKGGPKG
jgi:hypothetical protein